MKFLVSPKPKFRVLIGNGETMETEGYIDVLTVIVQNQELHMHVYLLPIVGAALILGSTWLATLGLHLSDY